MIIALLIFFIATVFLMWQGTLSLTFGLLLSIGSAAGLLYIFIKNARLSLNLQKATKKYKAKWVGAVAIVSGLSTALSSDSMLLLNRRDELIIDGPYRSITLPLESIESIAVLYGDSIMRNSDRDLSEMLDLGMLPNFSYIRAYLKRNPQAKRQRFILLKPFATSDEIERSDMIVLVEGSALSNLRALLNRPEIASIARVLDKRSGRKNKKKPQVRREVRENKREDAKPRRSIINENISVQNTGTHEIWAGSDYRDKGVYDNDSKSR
ncbi:MAG: hypothetical protein PHR78_05120 [Eubacteriales bacterium]|nr:hypothetical protein [Eubacteriales bacterium]